MEAIEKGMIDARPIRDKKLQAQVKRKEKDLKEHANAVEEARILQTEQAGGLEPETPLEKTWRLRQKNLVQQVDSRTARKLDAMGPYTLDFVPGGKHILLGGKKGHIAVFDWRKFRMKCELHLHEAVRDVHFLHNLDMFAVAQKKYVFLYDSTGAEVHCLKNHIEVNRLEFLRYHFLLVSVGSAGYLKYQDTSTGQSVAELRTRLGPCDVMRQNPHNAIMHLGHRNGTVTLWTPNLSKPIVKMLAHEGPVTALALAPDGQSMVTAGQDGQVSVWDMRTYHKRHSYYSIRPCTTLDISQRGMLSMGFGPHIHIWEDAINQKQSAPYLVHLLGGKDIARVRFAPFEDVLAVGHSRGITSMIVPGAGEPNIDSFVANPFTTKKQRREMEVHQLLEKIPADMIHLDPNLVGKVDRAHSDVLAEERKERETALAEQGVKKEKKKQRGRNRLSRRYKRKQANVVDAKRLELEKLIKKKKRQDERKKHGEPVEQAPPQTALSRFSK